MRPVYHRKAESTSIFADQSGNTDTLLFHDGVKWAIAKTTDITTELGRNPKDEEILLFFEKFHTMYGMDHLDSNRLRNLLILILPKAPTIAHKIVATIVTAVW